MRYFIFLYLLIFFLWGCSNNIHEDAILESKPINIQIKETNSSSKSFASFVSNITPIKLETNNSCLIGKIDVLREYKEDLYFIESTSSSSRILRFDSNGNFICQIGEEGRGPEEILFPRDFVFDGDTIEIWSQLKISKHNIDGEFIKNVFSAHFAGSGFVKIKENYFLFHSVAPPYMFSLLNKRGKQIWTKIPLNNIDGTSDYDKVIRFNGTNKFFSSTFDTVYVLIDKEVYPSIIFQYGGVPSPFSLLENSKNILEFVKTVSSNSYIINYLENSNLIIVHYKIRKNYFYCIIDKISLKSYYYKDSDFALSKSFPLKNIICLTESNELIVPVFYNDLSILTNLQNSIMPEPDPMDNPVLLKLKINISWNE